MKQFLLHNTFEAKVVIIYQKFNLFSTYQTMSLHLFQDKMSLKSINSDDLTAFSTTSSPNVESNATVDGVSSILKDDVCFTQEQSSHEALKTSLYDSLFNKDSVQDGM